MASDGRTIVAVTASLTGTYVVSSCEASEAGGIAGSGITPARSGPAPAPHPAGLPCDVAAAHATAATPAAVAALRSANPPASSVGFVSTSRGAAGPSASSRAPRSPRFVVAAFADGHQCSTARLQEQAGPRQAEESVEHAGDGVIQLLGERSRCSDVLGHLDVLARPAPPAAPRLSRKGRLRKPPALAASAPSFATPQARMLARARAPRSRRPVPLATRSPRTRAITDGGEVQKSSVAKGGGAERQRNTEGARPLQLATAHTFFPLPSRVPGPPTTTRSPGHFLVRSVAGTAGGKVVFAAACGADPYLHVPREAGLLCASPPVRCAASQGLVQGGARDAPLGGSRPLARQQSPCLSTKKIPGYTVATRS